MKYFPVDKNTVTSLHTLKRKKTSKLSPFGFRTPNAFAC